MSALTCKAPQWCGHNAPKSSLPPSWLLAPPMGQGPTRTFCSLDCLAGALPADVYRANLQERLIRLHDLELALQKPIRCPVHHMPDCGPLLNGCSLVIHLSNYRDGLLTWASEPEF